MYEAIIKNVFLFSQLPPDEIDTLAAELTEIQYPANTILLKEGEYGDKFYIVIEGTISVVKDLGSTTEQMVRLASTGDFVGEMSLINRDGLRTASARANTNVRLLEMTRAVFEALLSKHPEIAYQVASLLSKRLNEAHEKSIRDLKEKSQRLAEAYEELQNAQAQIIEKELIERELHQARELQRSILPQELPHLDGYDLGAQMIPARMVGGDFYDVIPLDADHLGLAVGDISGKGIPAALFMSLTCSLLRVEAHLCMSPYKVLQQVNQHLIAINAHGIFVTLLYGILHQSTHDFTYARAGHELPMLWDNHGNIVPVAEGRGQPLGLFNKPVLDRKKLKLTPGSTLLLYSDGVTEAQNAEDEFFGLEGIKRVMPGLLEHTAQGVCDQIVETIHLCCRDIHKADDITLLTLKALPR